MTANRRGVLITLEGIEGSGKTTQARLLVAHLEREGRDVVATREPGGTDIGKKIRAIVLDPNHRELSADAELLLYCADRAHHSATLIRPALERGAVVVCDRFSDATRAYQGLARGLGLALVDRANLGDLSPDLTLLYDLDPALGLERARARNRGDKTSAAEGRFEDEALDFHRSVRDGYLELARAAPDRIRVIDASGSAEALHRETVGVVAPHLESRSPR